MSLRTEGINRYFILNITEKLCHVHDTFYKTVKYLQLWKQSSAGRTNNVIKNSFILIFIVLTYFCLICK